MKITTKLWIGMAILIVLSPLGLIMPEHFKAGAAWGEWGADEMQALVGYIPKGLAKLSTLWNAPLPDYAFKGWEEKGLSGLSFAYIISAVVGIALVSALTWLIGKNLTKKVANNKK
ncbi:MAG: PDGLE domain-containing protein [Candidatus Omnitrophota bacterium]